MKWEYPEIEKAIARIEKRQRARTSFEFYRVQLQWFLDLVELDLGTLSEGDWMNLRYEALITLFLPDLSDEGFILPPPKDLHEFLPDDLPEKEDIRELQSQLQKRLNDFLTPGGEYSISSRMETRVKRIQAPDGSVKIIFSRGKKGDTERGLQIVASFLEDYGSLVNRCKECTRLFIADRSDQVYCSARCLNRVTQRRFREKAKKMEAKTHGKKRR